MADDDAPGGGTEFELDVWSVEDRELLDRLLNGEGVAHVWQGSTVVVSRADEHRVDELVDQVEDESIAMDGGGDGAPDVALDSASDSDDPWDESDEDDDDTGLGAQEALGAAFVAADRLARRASDPDGVVEMVEAHRSMVTMALPFGFEPATWDDLVGRVGVLGTALTAEDGDEGAIDGERIEELAGELRALLRPLV